MDRPVICIPSITRGSLEKGYYKKTVLYWLNRELVGSNTNQLLVEIAIERPFWAYLYEFGQIAMAYRIK